MKQLKEENRLLLIIGIPKQASKAESSGIWFCVFRDPALRALHSRLEFYPEDNCVVFAEWMEYLILIIIYSMVGFGYICIFLAALYLEFTFNSPE